VYGRLTVVDAVGNTSAALSVDGAYILLQAGVGDTASALRNGTVGVGALGHGSREGRESENNGGGGELHFCGCVGLLAGLKVSVVVFMISDY
jgi:hypothetical protein